MGWGKALLGPGGALIPDESFDHAPGGRDFWTITSPYDDALEGVQERMGEARTAIGESTEKGVATQRPYEGAGRYGLAMALQGLSSGSTTPGRFSYGGPGPSKFSYGGEVSRFEAPEVDYSYSMSDLEQDPGYQFRKEEAMKELDRRAAGGQIPGGLGGSGAMRGAAQVVGDLASQEYDKALGRKRYGDEQRMQTALTKYGLDRAAETDEFGRAVTRYGLDTAREKDIYGRDVGEYGIETQRLADLFRRQFDLAEMGQKSAGAMGTLYGQEGINLADIYKAQAEAEAAAKMGEAESDRRMLGDFMDLGSKLFMGS